MKFEIFEQSNKRGRRKLNDLYPNTPMRRVALTALSFNTLSCEILDIKEKDEILFSKVGDIYYICNCTNNYKSGYTVRHIGRSVVLSSKKLIKNLSLRKGYYEVSEEAVWDETNKLDWFEFTLIKEKE